MSDIELSAFSVIFQDLEFFCHPKVVFGKKSCGIISFKSVGFVLFSHICMTVILSEPNQYPSNTLSSVLVDFVSLYFILLYLQIYANIRKKLVEPVLYYVFSRIYQFICSEEIRDKS